MLRTPDTIQVLLLLALFLFCFDSYQGTLIVSFWWQAKN
jgi:hypothetical protein